MSYQRPKKFNPFPFEYHQIVTLKIHTLTNLGLGLGRIEITNSDNTQASWVVMVPFTLPGETVTARIYRNHKNYSQADLISIIEPSPDRIDPICPLFGACGGCQYQHLQYSSQLIWKQNQVTELFARIAKINLTAQPTIGSPKTYHYRSKHTPHYNKTKSTSFPIGFLKEGTHNQIIDVPQCPIATDAINQKLPSLRKECLLPEKPLHATLLLRDTGTEVCTQPKSIVQETVGKYTYQFVAGEFFQNNPFILPELINYVIQQAQGNNIQYLVDAYCGVGMFAIAASQYFSHCTGIEINTQAITLATKNAHNNQVTNCTFVGGSAEKIFSHISYNNQQTTVIIDPPRKGCDAHFLEQLIAFSPQRIVYISCAPDTQARDAAFLVNHGYSPIALQPFDLFPQTRHIENVLTLEKS